MSLKIYCFYQNSTRLSVSTLCYYPLPNTIVNFHTGLSTSLLIAKIPILTIALCHLYILILEMFLWNSPLTTNQGIYNDFLSAGLFWSLISVNFVSLAYFFLECIAIAGIFGAITINKKILFFQTIPVLIAIFFTSISGA